MSVFHHIGGVFAEVRARLETHRGPDGKIIKIVWSPELDFFQHVCLLVPDDLLYSPRLNKPPALACILACTTCSFNTTNFLEQRSADISDMVQRVLDWYDQ